MIMRKVGYNFTIEECSCNENLEYKTVVQCTLIYETAILFVFFMTVSYFIETEKGIIKY